jgi:hypothetical protein
LIVVAAAVDVGLRGGLPTIADASSGELAS